MQQDLRMREAARAIYDKVYPGEEWTPVPFEDAERHRTIHYRNAVDAALSAWACLTGDAAYQLPLELT